MNRFDLCQHKKLKLFAEARSKPRNKITAKRKREYAATIYFAAELKWERKEKGLPQNTPIDAGKIPSLKLY
jgi:hypothetical protein